MQRRVQRCSPHSILLSLVLSGLAACSPDDSEAIAPLESENVGGGGGQASDPDATGGAIGNAGDTAIGGGPSAGGSGQGSRNGTSWDGGSLPHDASTDHPRDAGELDAAWPGPALADAGADASAPPQRVDAGPPLDPALVRRLSELSARLTPLASRTAAFWIQRGPDPLFGGFHGTLDRNGNAIAPEEKGLIQQTRHLWTLSTWYERREQSAAVAELAADMYAFIRRSFLAADGAFVFKVSRDGSRVVDSKKQLFAESYAIYALSTYGRVFGVEEATGLALRRFLSIDASRHDAVFGGYDQSGDPGFLSAGAEKDTNTHLHLMEAFTALYEATADARVSARLNELVELFAERLLQPAGHVPAEFSRDWTPFGAPRVSYGHDLETAWLLLEAARVLGRSADTSLRSAALVMAAHSAARGFDAATGAYFEAGVPNGAVNDFDRIWWVQFEALEGLWWAYDVSGEGGYLDRLERTLGWIEESEDLPAGEWFATTNANGTAVGADYKGDEWKESYHPVRSLVFLQDWIADELGSGSLSQ